MNSSFRLSNSKDDVSLNIGIPSLQKICSGNLVDEFRLYCQLSVEAHKLIGFEVEEEKLCNTTETLQVEPHYVNFTSSVVSDLDFKEKPVSTDKDLKSSAVPKTIVLSESATEDERSDLITALFGVKEKKSSAGQLQKYGENRRNKKDKAIRRRGSLENRRDSPADLDASNSSISLENGGKSSLLSRGAVEPEKKPPDIRTKKGGGSTPFGGRRTYSGDNHATSYKLPTAPLPVSELGSNFTAGKSPQSVTAGGGKPAVKNVVPDLSNLNPIPFKQLQQTKQQVPGTIKEQKTGHVPGQPAATGANVSEQNGDKRVNAGNSASNDPPEFMAIQVPMTGADGKQVMQTINVPKSVLMGASERPVLLTVTPKNGVNKGQKQIVVLTRNAGSIGAVAKPQAAVLAKTAAIGSPALAGAVKNCKPGTMGNLKAGTVVNSQPPTASGTAPSGTTPPDINRLLSQVKPVSSSELLREGRITTSSGVLAAAASLPTSNGPTTPVRLVSSTGVIANSPNVVLSSSAGPTIAVVKPTTSLASLQPGTAIGQLQSNTGQPVTILQSLPSGAAGNQQGKTQVIQRAIVLPSGSSGTIRPQQILVRTAVNGGAGGQPQPTTARLVQQVVRPVVAGQKTVVLRTAVPQQQQTATGTKMVLSHNGQMLQGPALAQLAGQIINTSQGQFLIGSNGQLIPAQKIIQTSPSGVQTVRYIAMSPQPTATGQLIRQNIITSQASVPSSAVIGSTATGSGVVVSGVNSPGTVLLASAGSGLNSTATILTSRGLPSSNNSITTTTTTTTTLSASALVSPSATVYAPGGPITSTSGVSVAVGGGSVPTPHGVAGPSPVTNTPVHRFLNVLSNRGLLSQQNGKFYYVGERTSKPADTTASTTATQKTSTPVQQTAQKMVQVVVSAPAGLESFTASPSLVKLATHLMESQQQQQFSPSTSRAGVANLQVSSATSLNSQQVPISSVGVWADSSHQQSPAGITQLANLITSPTRPQLNSSGVTELVVSQGFAGGGNGVQNKATPTHNANNGPADDFSGVTLNGHMVNKIDDHLPVLVLPDDDQDFTMGGNVIVDGRSTFSPPPMLSTVSSSPTKLKSSSATTNNSASGTVTTDSFVYKDPRLPSGWMVGVDKTEPKSQPGSETNNTRTIAVRLSFYSPGGDRMSSPTEVAHYLANKLLILPKNRNFTLPDASSVPSLEGLSSDRLQLVSNMKIPTVDPSAPVMSQVDSEGVPASTSNMYYTSGQTGLATSGQAVKRPAPSTGAANEPNKRAKYVFY